MTRQFEKIQDMKIGVVGLGLIGGSLAKAYKRAGARVYGVNRSKDTAEFALMEGAVDDELTRDNIGEMDLILISVTIDAACEWLKENADGLSDGEIVIDCCGIKRKICEIGFNLAHKYGFTFIGGHPMAGKQYGGFRNSSDTLFDGATMILVAEKRDDIELVAKLKKFFKAAGFGKLSFMTSDQHDKMIAFTSQMTHIASNAFVKSEEKYPLGFPEGGSFRDFTRVAELDESMWTDLIFENRDNVLGELRDYIKELKRYEGAIEDLDQDLLRSLFREGSKSKKTADTKDPVLTMKL